MKASMRLARTIQALAAVAALGGGALLPSVAGADASGPVAVPASVTVDAEVIRLDDLFQELPAGMNAAVARAPQPGRAIRFSASRLERIAEEHGIAWPGGAGGPDSVTVHRAVQRLGGEIITAAVRDALTRQGVDREVSVILSNPGISLELPTDAPATVAVSDLSYRPASGRFSATVSAPARGEPLERATVTGRAVRMLEVPVPAARIDRGEIIDGDDLRWISMPSDRLHRNHLTDADKIVGMSARRPLRPGEPMRTTAVEKPTLVTRNSLVTLRLDTARMTLTAQGRALEDGAKGETVRVINTTSQTTVTGIVAGSNVVTVQPNVAPRN